MQPVESGQPPGVIVLATGELTRYARALMCLMDVAVPAGTVASWHQGVLIAESLNAGIRTAMADPQYQWVWIMGDDHTFDRDVVIQLLARDKDVIAPLCLNRIPPLDPVILQYDALRHVRAPKPLEELPTSGLYRLADNETCGDAGLLIRRRVLEQIGPPWYERQISGALAAEDQGFTAKIKKAGFDIWIDMEHPIGHMGMITYVPVVRDGQWAIHLAASLTPVTEIRPVRRRVPA